MFLSTYSKIILFFLILWLEYYIEFTIIQTAKPHFPMKFKQIGKAAKYLCVWHVIFVCLQFSYILTNYLDRAGDCIDP